MHVVSKGSIDAVCFDALATLVRGDESIAFELGEIEDLIAVVTGLAEHVRSSRGAQSNLDKAVAGGALADFDSLPTTGEDEGAALQSLAVPLAADVAPATPPAVTGKKRGPKPKSATAAADRAAAQAPAPVSFVDAPSTDEGEDEAVEAAAPASPPSATVVGAEKGPDRRPAAEVITQAVIVYLEKRVRPQSFERILRAVRKVDGVPDDVGKNLMDLLKRLTKKGTLLRTPTGGFSMAGA
jgi:hypothetical protein